MKFGVGMTWEEAELHLSKSIEGLILGGSPQRRGQKRQRSDAGIAKGIRLMSSIMTEIGREQLEKSAVWEGCQGSPGEKRGVDGSKSPGGLMFQMSPLRYSEGLIE